MNVNHRTSEASEPALRQLSEALGLPELRSGRHALRNDKGWLDDKIEVGFLWHALVMPSFHSWAAIGMVHMDQSEFRGKSHAAIIKAAVVLFDHSDGHVQSCSATEMDRDPLAEALRGVQLLSVDRNVYLDGIGYRICTSGWGINATLHISNPRAASLRAIEHSLFQVASSVQKQTGMVELATYLSLWEGYLKR